IRPTKTPAIGNAQAARATAAPSTGIAGPYRSRVKNRMLARNSSARSFSHASSMVIAPLVYCPAFYGGSATDLLDGSRPTAAESTSSMPDFTSYSQLREFCLDLPPGHHAASASVAAREAVLTKPPRSLGRLEDLSAWLAHWQGASPPRLQRVEILVFAGNHGVTGQDVSAYPAEVTAQMVANFAAGGAAINQLARTVGAHLRVIPLALDQPTADFTKQPAMGEDEFLAAVSSGYQAVEAESDLSASARWASVIPQQLQPSRRLCSAAAALAGRDAAPALTMRACCASAT